MREIRVSFRRPKSSGRWWSGSSGTFPSAEGHSSMMTTRRRLPGATPRSSSPGLWRTTTTWPRKRRTTSVTSPAVPGHNVPARTRCSPARMTRWCSLKSRKPCRVIPATCGCLSSPLSLLRTDILSLRPSQSALHLQEERTAERMPPAGVFPEAGSPDVGRWSHHR